MKLAEKKESAKRDWEFPEKELARNTWVSWNTRKILEDMGFLEKEKNLAEEIGVRPRKGENNETGKIVV